MCDRFVLKSEHSIEINLSMFRMEYNIIIIFNAVMIITRRWTSSDKFKFSADDGR